MNGLSRRFAIGVVLACVIALFAADLRVDPSRRLIEQSTERNELDVLPMPAASSVESLGSTWYCAAGSTSPDGQKAHTIVVTNPGSALVGTMTLFPVYSNGEGSSFAAEAVVSQITIGAGSQVRLSLLEVLAENDDRVMSTAETSVAAMLEFAQPGVIVEHTVQSGLGADVGPCASDPSSEWYFATGTTTAGAAQTLAVLNPFATNAVLDISFATDDGSREPGSLSGLVVPPRTLRIVDIAAENPSRKQSSMMVRLRSGRVIAERMQSFETDEGLRGLTIALGASESALQWIFPAGRSISGAGESYVILNPSQKEADVEMLVKLDQRGADGVDSQPFSVTIGPGDRVGVVVDPDEALPSSDLGVSFGSRLDGDEPYWVLVQSFNNVPIVVERVVVARSDTAYGVMTGPGSPLASTEQWLSLPIELGASSPQVAVVNPANDTIARLEVQAIVDDTLVDVTSVEIAPGGRVAADLSASLPVGSVALRLSSSTPVVSEVVVASPFGAVSSNGVPVSDAVSEPRLVVDF